MSRVFPEGKKVSLFRRIANYINVIPKKGDIRAKKSVERHE